MSDLSDATWDWILMFVKASKAFVEFCTRRNRAGKSLARHRQFMRRDGRVIVADVLLVSSKLGTLRLGQSSIRSENWSTSRGYIGLDPCGLVISQDMVTHGRGMYFGAISHLRLLRFGQATFVCNLSLQLHYHLATLNYRVISNVKTAIQ